MTTSNPLGARPEPVKKPSVEAHPVTFTGTGGEYFRVWIVNVLLSIVTLGIYTPWARRRTAQYFYSHTHVAGSPLEFVAEQRRMVFGFLAFAGLYLAYQLAAETGQQLAAGILLFGFAALTPFLWASAMRFRLAATRWRGIRMAFTASWKEVYLASWPVFAIAAIWAAVFFIGAAISPQPPIGVAGAERPMPLPAETPAVFALGGLGLVLTLLCVIRLEYNYRRLLVARARIGGQVGRWKPVYMDFVKVWLATALFFVIALVVVGLTFSTVTVGLGYVANKWLGNNNIVVAILVGFLAFVVIIVLMFLLTIPARAFREARMFQLVWNNIGLTQIVRTKTALKTGAYVWLKVKNTLLSVFTLGFYRPFAITSEYAARVGSVTLYIKGGTDQLVGELVKQQGAFGDAAADAFGLDLIG